MWKKQTSLDPEKSKKHWQAQPEVIGGKTTYKHVPSRSRVKRAGQGLVEIMRLSKDHLLLLLKV